MPTLYETIRTWRDAQRALNEQAPADRDTQQAVVDRLVSRLHRHRSLADLANGYYKDGGWWQAVVQEFCADPAGVDGKLLRDVAYYQRLLELRQPGGR